MTIALIALILVLAAALSALAWHHRRVTVGSPTGPSPSSARRILFPFVAADLSEQALDAALRLARAEDATLMPVLLAQVPLNLPIDSPLPRQAGIAIPLQEAIEQRAAAFGVPVDARLERGRTYRHALRQTILNDRCERIVIAAAAHDHPGFHPDDVAWLLENAAGEIVVLRPAVGSPMPVPGRAGRSPRREHRGGRMRELGGHRRDGHARAA